MSLSRRTFLMAAGGVLAVPAIRSTPAHIST